MKPKLPLSISIALVTGLVQEYVLIFIWGYIAANSPLVKWLLNLGLRGDSLRVVVSASNLMINVFLSLPAGYVLIKLRPTRLPLFLLVAVLPAFILLNAPLISTVMVAEFWKFTVSGWIQQCASLPIAAYLLRLITRPSRPNDELHAMSKIADA